MKNYRVRIPGQEWAWQRASSPERAACQYAEGYRGKDLAQPFEGTIEVEGYAPIEVTTEFGHQEGGT